MTMADDGALGSMTDPASDLRRLRSVLGEFLTGVTTVSFRDEERVWAFTANSFTSVSLDPPLVLFCIANTAASADRLQSIEEFCISFLAEDQQHISDTFGRPGRHREKLAHSAFEGVVPALRGAACCVCAAAKRGRLAICAGNMSFPSLQQPQLGRRSPNLDQNQRNSWTSHTS